MNNSSPISTAVAADRGNTLGSVQGHHPVLPKPSRCEDHGANRAGLVDLPAARSQRQTRQGVGSKVVMTWLIISSVCLRSIKPRLNDHKTVINWLSLTVP